jgi:ribosomal protein S27E
LRSRRKHERFVRRLETEFSSEGKVFRGISSDFSVTGVFIRTKNPFSPGSIIDIKIHLPEGSTSNMKGKVMRAIKSNLGAMKNGMGISLLEKDIYYINFMKTFSPDIDEEPTQKTEHYESNEIKTEKKPEPSGQDFLVLSCSNCRAKNKVPRSRLSQGPKCGKCGSPLVISAG